MSSRILAWHSWLHSASLPVILDASVGEELKRRLSTSTLDHAASITITHDTKEPSPFDSVPLWASSLLVTPQGRAEISRLAREYLEAGADILTAATYQATPDLFAAEFPRIDMEIECPFRASVALLDASRKKFWAETKTHANNGRRYPAIAASIGPLASWMPGESEYTGTYSGVTFQDFCASHKASALKFTHPGICTDTCNPDVLAFETIPSGLEAEAIASVMSNTWELTNVPYWICFQARDHSKLANGDSVMQVVENVLRYSKGTNLVAIGVNCVDIKYVPALVSNIDRAIKCFRKFNVVDHKSISIVVYPDNGFPKKMNRNNSHSRRDVNVDIVGACCGVGPAGLKEYVSSGRKDSPR